MDRFTPPPPTVTASPLSLTAGDGYPLAAHHWQPAGAPVGAVVINPATAVKAAYYHRYARYLAENGFAVLTYDYRGIGASRRGSLRRWRHISKLDWGRYDCEAALAWAKATYPDLPLHLVAHSIGGLLLGLAPSGAAVQRAFTVGSQYAYWPDYGPGKPLMWLRWHVLMPLLTAVLGYFPARRLGWHEDLPAAAAYEWAFRPASLEKSYRRHVRAGNDPLAHFDAFRGEMLAVGLADDPFGTPAAIRRLLGYYRAARRHHLHLSPEAAGVAAIGHFAWFHERFRTSLWPASLAWLRDGDLPEQAQPVAHPD
ncbi:MAG TPA: alpha/beta fold hydrolase [Azospira sp.]|nr:alpha/beta fold hydrolase [Azospira sp.]